MYNLLIIEKDLVYSHFLINSICKEIQEIRIYNITSTGREAVSIIKERKVDLIILNMDLPDMYGKEIIDYISENNINKYKSSIIIYKSKMSDLEEITKSKYIFSYFSKSNSIDFLISEIKKLIEVKQKEKDSEIVENKIKVQFKNLKLDFSYVGTKYLYECIYECYYKRNINDINLNRDIYPIIAKRYNKSISAIKSSICKVITLIYYESEEKYLSNYLGYDIINKPKTKDIITKILTEVNKKIY